MESTQFFLTSSADRSESEALILFRHLSEQDQKDAIVYMHRLLDEQIAAATAEWGEK